MRVRTDIPGARRNPKTAGLTCETPRADCRVNGSAVMPSGKPIVFVSYAHRDEPEKPGPEGFAWLSFVLEYLNVGKRAELSICGSTRR